MNDAMNDAEHWAWMINNSRLNNLDNVTAKQAKHAMQIYTQQVGPEYAKTFNLAGKWIDSEDREALARIIEGTA